MDRLAAHIVATAVLTAALAAIPAAVAQPAADTRASTNTASNSPASTNSASAARSPNPSPSSSASLAPSPSEPTKQDAPTPRKGRQDASPLPCPDAYQVGATGYARWHGAIAFSVKQFYSPICHARYGYAYPWLQFRVKRVNYDLGMADFDMTHDAIDGARTFIGAGGPDFWSYAVSVPTGTCTQGLGHVFFPDNETDTFTVKFCL